MRNFFAKIPRLHFRGYGISKLKKFKQPLKFFINKIYLFKKKNINSPSIYIISRLHCKKLMFICHFFNPDFNFLCLSNHIRFADFIIIIFLIKQMSTQIYIRDSPEIGDFKTVSIFFLSRIFLMYFDFKVWDSP